MKLIKTIHSFIKNSTFQVKINGVSSEGQDIAVGVPPGSTVLVVVEGYAKICEHQVVTVCRWHSVYSNCKVGRPCKYTSAKASTGCREIPAPTKN